MLLNDLTTVAMDDAAPAIGDGPQQFSDIEVDFWLVVFELEKQSCERVARKVLAKCEADASRLSGIDTPSSGSINVSQNATSFGIEIMTSARH